MPISVTNPAQSALQRILVRDIEVDGEQLNLSTSELFQVRIQYNENSHDVAVITTQLTKAQISRFVNKPISFSFGRRSGSADFYGYVVAINPNRGYRDDTIVDIRCLGPTWVMQYGNPRFSINETVPSQFGAVVNNSALAAQVDSHPYRFPALACTNGSDWEYLQYLSHLVGYVIYNYQGMVRLVNPIRVLTETPIYRTYLKGDDVLDNTRELLDWDATTESLSLRENMPPVFGYLDAASARVSESATDPRPRFDSRTLVKSREMAQVYREAWDRRIDFWNNTANARIQGDAKVYPGMNVAIKLSGLRGRRNDYDGIWLVRTVSHSITHNAFQTLLGLARSSSLTPVNADASWFWSTARGGPDLQWDEQEQRWRSRWVGVDVVNAPLL